MVIPVAQAGQVADARNVQWKPSCGLLEETQVAAAGPVTVVPNVALVVALLARVAAIKVIRELASRALTSCNTVIP